MACAPCEAEDIARERRPVHAGLFHITARSIASESIFETTADYRDGVMQLAQLVREERIRCHAFCLMPTHYRLVASVADGALAGAVQRLHRRYADGFNRRHNRRGHVFDSPYRAVEVTGERHLLVLPAYLAHNPGSRLDWPWSSYAGTVGKRGAFSFVEPGPLVEAFGDAERLRRFVESWQPTQRDLELVAGRRHERPVPGTSAQPSRIAEIDPADVPGTGYSERRMVTAPPCSPSTSKPFRS